MDQKHKNLEMSEEEYSFLNVKRSSKRMTTIKHSTPLGSIFFTKMSSLEDLTEQTNQALLENIEESNRPLSPPPFTRPFQDELIHQPEVKTLSTFHRTRLSTVLASEESVDGTSSNAILPPVISKNSREIKRLSKKRTRETSQNLSILQASGIPGIPDEQKMKKKNKEKELMMKRRVRKWEICQLKNIEEATTHELVIEEA
ncbi:uncharacterized protein LOC115084600 [Rhinatrema bivittatum]|uniref:uncharacterized protein LOC115084600 n=1 Tax=Rhinatrema bivittatum TaxID=194408 RepID=UPI001129570F|nr:uncharacterized protein LOC115084600 [Rhinatrema bivittatum]